MSTKNVMRNKELIGYIVKISKPIDSVEYSDLPLYDGDFVYYIGTRGKTFMQIPKDGKSLFKSKEDACYYKKLNNTGNVTAELVDVTRPKHREPEAKMVINRALYNKPEESMEFIERKRPVRHTINGFRNVNEEGVLNRSAKNCGRLKKLR